MRMWWAPSICLPPLCLPWALPSYSHPLKLTSLKLSPSSASLGSELLNREELLRRLQCFYGRWRWLMYTILYTVLSSPHPIWCRPWSDNAKQHNERSLLIWLGDGQRDWLWKRSGWTGGWFELAVVVVGSVQKPTQEATWGWWWMWCWLIVLPRRYIQFTIKLELWLLFRRHCRSFVLVLFYHCCDVIMMMVLLVVVGQKGRWWRASWRRWRRDGRAGIVSWIETRWIIMGDMGVWRRRGGMESHFCRGGMVWYDVVQRIL